MHNISNIRFLKPLLLAATLSLSLPGSADAPDQSGATDPSGAAAEGATPAATTQDRRASHRSREFPISVADLEARAAATFTRLDGNGDGVIDPEEFEAGEGRRGTRGGKGAHGSFGPPGSPHMNGDRPSPKMEESDRAARHAEMEAKLFESLDKDADGALSPVEFAGLQDARETLMRQGAFARLDANGDGVLDQDEFPPRRLASLDANGDGEISREEMRSQRARKQQPAG